MGCDGINVSNYTENKETSSDFKSIQEKLKNLKKIIDDYKINKNRLEILLTLKNNVNNDLNEYFKIINKKILINEVDEIKNYQKTFQKINKIEEKMNVNPKLLNIGKNNE
jgi:hypothetical protein